VLGAAELEKMEKFYRYLDSDGDGIPYRTFPGDTHRGGYFVRGSGHNRYGGYTEDGDEYQEVVDRLLVKWETARGLVPGPVLRKAERKTRFGVIAYGSLDGAVNEALDGLAEDGFHADYLRIRSFPFNEEVLDFLAEHDRIFVVEQNRDAQLRSLLIIETPADDENLIKVLHYNGMPIPSACIVEAVHKFISKEVAA